jgi:hypothetical protein
MDADVGALLDAGELQELLRSRIQRMRLIADELPVHLARIARAAEGRAADREEVLSSTGAILEYLCRGPLSPQLSVPKEFWLSSIGLMIARAHAQVVGDDEVMSQAEAAQSLGVSREYISQLVEGGRVATVVREAAAPRSRKQPREMVYRASVEALRPLIRSRTESGGSEAGWNDGRPPTYAVPQADLQGSSHDPCGHPGRDRAPGARLP